MRILLLCLLGFAQAARAQTAPPAIQRCDFKTDGSGKSKGIRLSMAYPCAWTPEDDAKSNVVRQFTGGDDDEILAAMLFIKPAGPGASVDERIRKLRETPDDAKGAKMLSVRKLRLAGQDCAETLVSIQKNVLIQHLYVYILSYQFFYKGQSVVLSYSIGGTNNAKARALYDAYKGLCADLAAATVFLP